MTIEIDGTVRRGGFSLDLELEIPPGRMAIVGPNGAGKTTLLRLIAGLEALDRGTLCLDGTTLDDPARGLFVPAHERPVAMAFQDHRLFPHLRVLDNVAYPLRRQGHHRDEAHAVAREHLDAVGLSAIADARPDRLSGGQRQRVAVARALIGQAEVLLLDEPLAGVDDVSRAILREQLTSPPHPTVIWVTHDPADAELSDRAMTVDGTVIRETAES